MTQCELFLALYDAGFDVHEPHMMPPGFDMAAYVEHLRTKGLEGLMPGPLRWADVSVSGRRGARHRRLPAISVRLPRQTTIYTAAYLLVELDHQVGRRGRMHSAKQIKVGIAVPQDVADLLKHAVAKLEREAEALALDRQEATKARDAALKLTETFEIELAQNFPDVFGQRAVALRQPLTPTPVGVSLTLDIRGTTSKEVSDVLMKLQRMGAKFSHGRVTFS